MHPIVTYLKSLKVKINISPIMGKNNDNDNIFMELNTKKNNMY